MLTKSFCSNIYLPRLQDGNFDVVVFKIGDKIAPSGDDDS
jgi:hypothetical protein